MKIAQSEAPSRSQRDCISRISSRLCSLSCGAPPNLAVDSDTLRQEAGRCWSEMVQAHVAAREQGVWLAEADLNALTKGHRYALHSQSIQFLAQQLLANVATARQNRAAGKGDVNYPYRAKAYQTVVWKGQWIRVVDGQLVLPNGRKQRDLADDRGG